MGSLRESVQQTFFRMYSDFALMHQELSCVRDAVADESGEVEIHSASHQTQRKLENVAILELSSSGGRT